MLACALTVGIVDLSIASDRERLIEEINSLKKDNLTQAFNERMSVIKKVIPVFERRSIEYGSGFNKDLNRKVPGLSAWYDNLFEHVKYCDVILHEDSTARVKVKEAAMRKFLILSLEVEKAEAQ